MFVCVRPFKMASLVGLGERHWPGVATLEGPLSKDPPSLRFWPPDIVARLASNNWPGQSCSRPWVVSTSAAGRSRWPGGQRRMEEVARCGHRWPALPQACWPWPVWSPQCRHNASPEWLRHVTGRPSTAAAVPLRFLSTTVDIGLPSSTSWISWTNAQQPASVTPLEPQAVRWVMPGSKLWIWQWYDKTGLSASRITSHCAAWLAGWSQCAE